MDDRPRARAAAASARLVRLFEDGTRIVASRGPERRIFTLAGSGAVMCLVYTRSMRETARRRLPFPPRITLAILALLTACGLPAAASQGKPVTPAPVTPPPRSLVETVDVSIVLVPVVVRDASGRPVTDLAREDFKVTEEGEGQEITAFGREARPVSIVLAIDTSPSMQGQELGAKRAAIDFVRRQGSDVAFAVVAFNDVVSLETEFTTDRGVLENALAALRLEGDNTALFDAVTASAHALEAREGGRIAVIFTDGAETLHPQDQSEKRLSEAIEESTRRDVAVYTVPFGPHAAASVLRRISTETGGEAFSAATATDLGAAFAGVAASVGSRYLLGYRAPSGVTGFRRIEVKIQRPDLRVAARRGYFAR